MREKITILGVNFDKITTKDALEKISAWLSPGLHLKKRHVIVTPNPEILLHAQKDAKYRRILNRADLSIPDGIGVLWASKFKKISKNNDSTLKKCSKWLVSLSMIPFSKEYIRTELPERVTGVDLMEKICKLAAIKESKVFLLGAGKGVAERTAEKLMEKYPEILITGLYAGTPKEKHERKIRRMIEKSEAEVLFVAYGAPNQEKWMERNIRHLSNIKVAMGVGGSFDFISGEKKRAPTVMQKTGLEWLYRLAKQPSRAKRILNATVVFPIKVFRRK